MTKERKEEIESIIADLKDSISEVEVAYDYFNEISTSTFTSKQQKELSNTNFHFKNLLDDLQSDLDHYTEMLEDEDEDE